MKELHPQRILLWTFFNHLYFQNFSNLFNDVLRNAKLLTLEKTTASPHEIAYWIWNNWWAHVSKQCPIKLCLHQTFHGLLLAGCNILFCFNTRCSNMNLSSFGTNIHNLVSKWLIFEIWEGKMIKLSKRILILTETFAKWFLRAWRFFFSISVFFLVHVHV